MQTTQRAIQLARARTRQRGLRRLRSMTVGTTVMGFAATGAFGVLAAATYAGSPLPATTGAGQDASQAGVVSSRVHEDDDNDGGGEGFRHRFFGSAPEVGSAPQVFGALPNAHASTGGS